MSSRVAAVASLYEGVVTDPDRWNDQMFIDWADAVAMDGSITKDEARQVRRAVNVARKLKRFWSEATHRSDLGWESRVDLVLGPRAWRPMLELAEIRLAATRDADAFDEVARLFRLVNQDEFMDGIDYAAWMRTQT